MSTKTSVSSSALHLIEVPDHPLKTVAMAAILGKDDLVSSVFKYSMGTLNGRMGSAFNYAEDFYTLALPTGKTSQLNSASNAEVKAAILDETSYPFDIVVAEYKYVTYEPYYEIMEFLITERGLDTVSNAIHAYPGLSFSNGQQINITDWSLSTDALSVNMSYAYYGYTEVEYTDSEGNRYREVAWTNISNHTETVPRPNTTNTVFDDNCLFARYVKLDALGDPLPEMCFWVYHISTKVYPDLDNTIKTITSDKYFPVVPLRYNNVDLTADDKSDTDLYKTSKRLLKILDISFTDLGAKINESPDIASIDHAYVIFGADLQSNKPATLAYLNYYFDYIGTLNTTVYESSDPYYYWDDLPTPNSTFTEHGLSLTLAFDSITTRTIPGKIDDGKVGNARKTITSVYIPPVIISTNTEGGTDYGPEGYDHYLTLDLQITKTTIRQVVIKNLTATNYVYGSYSVVTTLDLIQNDSGNDNLIIPLEYNMTLILPNAQRTALYADCLLLVVNAVERRKLKWYEESWFQFIVLVIIIVISVISFQYYLTAAYDTAYAAAIAGGATIAEATAIATTAVLYAAAMAVVISVIVSVAMRIIVKNYGAKLGIIGAVILTIIAMVASQGKYGYQILAQYTLSYSQLALQCAMALISSVNDVITAAVQTLVEEYEAFSDLLKTAYEALDSNAEMKAIRDFTKIDLFAAVQAKDYYSIPNEYPDEFFERTLYFCKNNVYGIHGAIKDFAENLLTIDNDTVTLVS